MRSIVLIAHNLRSCHNIGSLLRTCEGLGVQKVYLTGYTPYPLATSDVRLPHIATKISKQIHKTALGAENIIVWEHREEVATVIDELKCQQYVVVALEQTSSSISLPNWDIPEKLALVVGREVEGVEAAVLKKCDYAVQIPMLGQKESFNVVQAAAMAMYACRFSDLSESTIN